MDGMKVEVVPWISFKLNGDFFSFFFFFRKLGYVLSLLTRN